MLILRHKLRMSSDGGVLEVGALLVLDSPYFSLDWVSL